MKSTKWHVGVEQLEGRGNTLCGRTADLAVSAEEFHHRLQSERCQRCERLDTTKLHPGTGHND